MSRNGARVDEESDGEEAQHKPWQPDWEQNAWDDSDKDQLVLPDDSASNVESTVSPPSPSMSSARAAGTSRHSRASSNKSNAFSQSHPRPLTSTPVAASGNFYSALGVIAEQSKAQQDQLHNEIERMHGKIANMAYTSLPTRTPADEKRRSTQHHKEATLSTSVWDQAPAPVAGNSWSQWGATAAAPPPSEVNASANHKVHKSAKEAKKAKGRKRNSDNLASNIDDTWGTANNGEGVWAQETNGWGNGDGWGEPQQASSSKTKKRSSAWDETNTWANPAPPMDNSTSWNAWDNDVAEAEQTEEKKSGGIGRLFGKIFGRKSKGKEKHVQIKDAKPKRSKSKTLKKKRDSDSDKTTWPDEETMEEAERQQEWDEAREEEENGWGTNDGWETAQNDWGKQNVGGWAKDTGGWAKGTSGGWKSDTGEGWSKDAGESWGKEVAGGRRKDVGNSWNKNSAVGWGVNANGGEWPNGSSAWEKDPPRPAQSRTHSYATQGSSFAQPAVPRGYHCIDSGGEAIHPAQAAFYSRQRLARDRIFWAFDPNHDQRVAMMLHWIEHMKSDIAIFGFEKFMQEKDRGALFTNADYRPPLRPQEPAFDWLSFDHIQMTYDRTFGESLACYDPAKHVLVFVFLLSESKRSMAVWRRKLEVPKAVLQAYSREFRAITANLRPLDQLQIPIDEELPSASTPHRSGSKKNKWLRWA